MVAATKLAHRTWQHIGIHGDPKSGKSTLASKLALHGYRLDWFSLDNGHEVIFKLPDEALSRINIYHLPDTRNFPVGIATLRKVLKGGKWKLCDSHGQVDCSVCKSKGQPFSEVHLDDGDPMHVTVIDHASAAAESAMNVAYQKFNKPDEDAPQQEFKHHGLQGFLMNEILSAVQHFQGHVIVISHSLEVEMEDGKKRIVPQIGSREFSRNAGKYFDHVIHCAVNNLSHKFGSKTTYSAMVLTGSRSDVDIATGGNDPSLLPFFTTSIRQQVASTSKEYGAETAQKVVEKATPTQTPSMEKQLDSIPVQETPRKKTPQEILAELQAKKKG